MPSFPRLVIKVPSSSEQIQAVKYLMDAEGLCVCGRYLKPTDGKLCLGQVNTDYFADIRGRNTVIIAAYCWGCAQQINEVLKRLNRSLLHPEPDMRRHENGA